MKVSSFVAIAPMTAIVLAAVPTPSSATPWTDFLRVFPRGSGEYATATNNKAVTVTPPTRSSPAVKFGLVILGYNHDNDHNHDSFEAFLSEITSDIRTTQVSSNINITAETYSSDDKGSISDSSTFEAPDILGLGDQVATPMSDGAYHDDSPGGGTERVHEWWDDPIEPRSMLGTVLESLGEIYGIPHLVGPPVPGSVEAPFEIPPEQPVVVIIDDYIDVGFFGVDRVGSDRSYQYFGFNAPPLPPNRFLEKFRVVLLYVANVLQFDAFRALLFGREVRGCRHCGGHGARGSNSISLRGGRISRFSQLAAAFSRFWLDAWDHFRSTLRFDNRDQAPSAPPFSSVTPAVPAPPGGVTTPLPEISAVWRALARNCVVMDLWLEADSGSRDEAAGVAWKEAIATNLARLPVRSDEEREHVRWILKEYIELFPNIGYSQGADYIALAVHRGIGNNSYAALKVFGKLMGPISWFQASTIHGEHVELGRGMGHSWRVLERYQPSVHSWLQSETHGVLALDYPSTDKCLAPVLYGSVFMRAAASLCTRQGLPTPVVHDIISKTLEAENDGPAVSLWVIHCLLRLAQAKAASSSNANPGTSIQGRLAAAGESITTFEDLEFAAPMSLKSFVRGYRAAMMNEDV